MLGEVQVLMGTNAKELIMQKMFQELIDSHNRFMNFVAILLIISALSTGTLIYFGIKWALS